MGKSLIVRRTFVVSAQLNWCIKPVIANPFIDLHHQKGFAGYHECPPKAMAHCVVGIFETRILEVVSVSVIVLYFG